MITTLIPSLLASLLAQAPPPPVAPPAQEPAAEAPLESRGVKINDGSAFEGYTLLAPLMDKRTFLLDMDGKVVHQWKHSLAPGNSVY